MHGEHALGLLVGRTEADLPAEHHATSPGRGQARFEALPNEVALVMWSLRLCGLLGRKSPSGGTFPTILVGIIRLASSCADLELAKGVGIGKVARLTGLGTGTVHKLKREMAAAA